MEKFRILEPLDTISNDVFTKVGKADHRGNFLVQNRDGSRVITINPSRILPIGHGLKVKCDHELHVICPSGCRIAIAINDATARCKHGKNWQLDWNGMAGKGRPVPKVEHVAVKSKTESKVKTAKKQQYVAINFAVLSKAGELWTKHDIEFDYPEFEVKAHVLIIKCGEQYRKICFNSYNGTWGKTSREEEMKIFLANGRSETGKAYGYPVGNIDKEHNKLRVNGYVRE